MHDTTAPKISTSDRLSFTVFIAIAVHAALILGVSFELLKQADQSPVIEVTLAQNQSDVAPEQADFMAQENQIGGGTLEEKASPTTTQQPAEFIDETVQPVAEPVQPPPQANETPRDQQVTTLESMDSINTEQQPQPVDNELLNINQQIAELERSLALSSMDLTPDVKDQFDTKRSRIHRINSVSALKTEDAYYVKQWINKIHRVGKLNYPEEARRRKIYGSLRLIVTLLPSGSVRDIQVLRSSGHKILDDAAIRIVRLAEPFAPFPDHLRKQYDQIEITRTWLFSKDGHSPVL